MTVFIDGPRNGSNSMEQKPVNNEIPVFGKDIVDDWSWDREEEYLREHPFLSSDDEG